MKKNTASQVIGVQMVSATDGSAFTSTVSCLVTGDGGTQGAGGGTVTHEGNGFHTYTPTQAETNYDHVAFTFTGTGAVPKTVQVYTTFPQTGDNYSRLGAPAGASIAADIATVDTVVDGISAALPTNFSDLAITATTGLVDVNDKTGYSISGTLTTLDALDTQQDAQHSTTQTAISNLNDPTAAAIADAVWDEAIAGHVGAGSTGEALNNATAPTAAAVADAVWDEALSGHLGAGSTGEALNAAGAAGDPWTTSLPGAYGAGSAGYIIGNNIDAPLSTIDTVVDGIQTDLSNATDGLGAIKTAVDAIPTSNPTAAAIADAVLDEALAGHVTAGTLGKAVADIETDATAILADTADMQPKLGTPAGASISADIAAIEAQTDDIGAAGAGLTAIPWNAAWDAEVQSEVNDGLVALGLDHLVSAAVIGTDVTDNSIVAKLVSKSATADWDSYDNTTDSLEATQDDATNILADTNELQTDWADGGRLDLILDARASQTTADAIETDTQDIQSRLPAALVSGRMSSDAVALSGSTTAADNLEASALAIISGAAAGTPTTTVIESNLTGYTNDQLIGRVVIFTSGNAEGEATDITDYVETSGVLTVTALSTAPAAADTFIIV